MPITIKELLPSDLMAQVVEKINFNFDQLLLAGGGPPGPQGPIGPAGTPGPIGPRGDHWFVGASAFNQQYDHDGISPLQIEDHFLDPLGDVYSYFDIAGVTGWTYSGINLMGPTGPTGPNGGSTEWVLFEASLPGNLISTPTYGPSPTTTSGTINIDYLVPVGSVKNSIFLGDVNWAYSYLQNYGTVPLSSPPPAPPYLTDAVPKFSIIQNNINRYGMNGLVIGAMGINENPHAITPYGAPTDVTNARNFFYAGFYDASTIGPGPSFTVEYNTKFLMRTLNMPMRIQAGGRLIGQSPAISGEASFVGKPLEILGSEFYLESFDTSGSQRRVTIQGRRVNSIFVNNGAFSGSVREININALQNVTASNIAGNSIWSYVALQNLEGSGGSNLGLQHDFGTVIIGPTYNSTIDRAYGFPGRQGLAIVRKITAISGTNNYLEYTPGQTVKDSAISFYQTDYASTGDLNSTSAIGGKITPVRTFNDPNFMDGDGIDPSLSAPNVIDSLIFSTGLRNPAVADTSATAGGRISIQNRASNLGKPQMPFHVSLDTDAATRNVAWDGGNSINGIQHWAVGFDQWAGETRPGGIAIAYSPWNDGLTSIGNFRRNPVIQTYYRGDRGTSQPNDGFGSRLGQSQGTINPHMYFQLGGQTNHGNIGIGFVPGNASYAVGVTAWNGDAAFAKVSIQGSVVIGSTTNGYHKFLANKFDNSLLVEGIYIQGATALFDQINTAVHGYTGTNTIMNGFIAMSTRDSIFGKAFVARGFKFPVLVPDFALPDMKTGMSQGSANPGIGYLVANNIVPAPSGDPYPTATNPTSTFNTTNPTRIAKFAGRGEAGYTGNVDYGSFTAEATFSTRPRTVTVNDLVQKFSTYQYSPATIPSVTAVSVWEIPSNSSLIFLDLSGYRNGLNMSVWNTSPNQWQNPIIADRQYTLDGSAWTTADPPVFIGRVLPTRSIGYTIEDGHFDGQTLKMIVLDVLPLNMASLLVGTPVLNGQIIQSTVASPVSDKIIMAPEPLWGKPQASPPTPGSAYLNDFNFSFGGVLNTLRRDGNNDAYPLPFGMGPSGPLSSTSTSAVPLRDEINNDMRAWTNNAYSNIFSGVGFGAFYLFPYRSIEFVWRFDGPNGISGKWFEIGRENLVRPQSRSYSPNDFFISTVIEEEPGDGDPGPIDIGPTGICCFAPGTMISMADGTLKEIENIQIGDLVLSYDESSGKIIENEVNVLTRPNRNDLSEIFFDDGTSVKITPDHPIYIIDKGWSAINSISGMNAYKIPVEKVEIGDNVLGINGNKTIVDIIELNILIRTYTFRNANKNAPSYFANGILAHNTKAPEDPFFPNQQQDEFLCEAYDPFNQP